MSSRTNRQLSTTTTRPKVSPRPGHEWRYDKLKKEWFQKDMSWYNEEAEAIILAERKLQKRR